jgi:MoxR-like ATPase
MFSWIPIHREAIGRILEYQERQSELLTILREMEQQGLKVISLKDEGADGKPLPLTEIDPFSFLASFNRRVTPENRRDNWAFLKTRLGLNAPVPDDFSGIPVLHNLTSRLFPYAKQREKDHIGLLWQIATLTAKGGIEDVGEELFNRCMDLETVGLRRLTICIFWINPEKFLPADSKTTAYAERKGILAEPKDYATYRTWMKEMTERLGPDYAQVSHDAHMLAISPKPPEGGQPEETGWKFAHWMGPILNALRSLGGSGTANVVLKTVVDSTSITDSKIHEQLASGQTRFYNQAHWARKYLMWEGLLESPERGAWRLTEKGASTILTEKQAQTIAEKWAKRHREGGIDRELGYPFDLLFSSFGEAQAAFDLLKWTLGCLGVSVEEAEKDDRIALTLPKGSSVKMRLNFGNWAILTFMSPDSTGRSVQFLSREGNVSNSAEFRPGNAFADTIDGAPFTLAYVAPNFIQDETSQVREEFKESLLLAAKRFEHWNRSPWRDLHKPELLRMVFDRAERDRLLVDGVTPSEEGDVKKGADNPAKTPSRGVRYWWLNANPKIWNFEETPMGKRQTYTSHNEQGNKRQKYRYFQEVQPGDLLFGYVTSPQKEIVALCKITKGLHQAEDGEKIEFEKIEQFATPVAYEILQANPDLGMCEPLINNQGTLCRLTDEEFEIIRSLIDESKVVPHIKIEAFDKKKALKGVFLPEAQFDEMLTALNEKKNVVLQGAPGVGKTYIARRLAYALIGSNDPARIEMIQFHQSYSYEDFIQGFRPTPKGTFDLKHGIFHQFCRRAQREEAEGKPYVFIIDEINRGNLSKIFGELMMLIEADKRGKEHAMPLAYSKEMGERFYIPENLHLIGMMNTADRSLAMVDYALRRRFRFITLRPEFSSAIFKAFLEDSRASEELVNKIVERMRALNDAIAADTKNLGPGYQIGHSYFCPRKGITPDAAWYTRVIEAEIVPLIQEYWFDNDQKVKEHQSALLA